MTDGPSNVVSSPPNSTLCPHRACINLCSHASSYRQNTSWSPPDTVRRYLEFVISEGSNAGLHGGVPVISFGQLGGELLVEGMQLGSLHRLLEQLLLHLLFQMLQCRDLRCTLGSSL